MRKLSLWLLILMAAALGCGAALADEDVLALPWDVQVIEAEAFRGIGHIDEVILSDIIETIGERAFAGDVIGDIYLPESLTFIADDAFDGPAAVNARAEYGSYAYDWAVENGYIEDLDAVLTLDISGSTATITRYTGSAQTLVVPDRVQGKRIVGVAENAFKDCGDLREVELPKTVTSIAPKAFDGCTSLEAYVGPLAWETGSGVDSPFYGAYHLKRVEITGTLSALPDYAFARSMSYVTRDGVTNCAFYGELESVILPGSVRSIGDYAFNDLECLDSIELPGRLQSIGANAFHGCAALTEIEVPEGVTSIGAAAFSDCPSLEHYTGPLAWTRGATADNPFYRSLYLRRIDITGTLEAVPDYAFARNDTYDTTTGIYLCYGSLEVVTLPEGVARIGEGAFRYLDTLLEMGLPQGLTEIGNQAFYGCAVLSSPAFPQGLVTIGQSAFEGCSAIEDITLPGSVTGIGDKAFAYCTSLARYEGPLAWTIGAENANPFYRAFELAQIKLVGDLTEIPDSAFAHNSADNTSGGAYNGRFVCFDKLQSIELPDTVTSIGASAFTNCRQLTAIELPAGVTTVGNLAFENCVALESYKGPIAWAAGTGETADNSPFKGAISLKRIELTEGVTAVPDYAFKVSNFSFTSGSGVLSGHPVYYGAIEEVVLPRSVTRVGAYAFANTRTKTLKRVYVAGSATTIGNKAFDGCMGQMTLYGPDNSAAQSYARSNGITFEVWTMPE